MSNADWWAKKLQQTNPAPAQPRSDNMPVAPSQMPMAPYNMQQPVPVASKAQSANQMSTCPDCGSANYFSIQGARARCYDCGYPLEQSGSKYGSLTGAQVVGDTKASRGNDATNNYNPQGIIGRIE